MTEPTKSTIAAKLVAAMKSIDAVTKRGKNEKYNYGYVKAADVANEVRAALGEHGIAFTYNVLGDERWEKPTQSGGSINYCQVRIAVTFIDADSGSQLTTESIGCGQDVGEKSVYKAMTGALKYALRMNFLIPDELDPENEKAEVFAEVERQKANPTKNPTPINNLTAQLKASVEKTLTPEERAAKARTELAEQQGVFSVENDILHCKIIGIQRKQMSAKTKTPGKEFLSVTFNGRLANGANFASVFDTELYEALNAGLDKEVKLKIAVKGAYVNVEDVLWIQGITGTTKEMDIEPPPFKANDNDIPF